MFGIWCVNKYANLLIVDDLLWARKWGKLPNLGDGVIYPFLPAPCLMSTCLYKVCLIELRQLAG